MSARGLSTCLYIKGVNVQGSEHYQDYVQNVNIGKENSLLYIPVISGRGLSRILSGRPPHAQKGEQGKEFSLLLRNLWVSAVGDVVLSPDILVLPRPALTGVVLEAYPQDAVLGPVVQQEVGRGLTFRGFDGERRV